MRAFLLISGASPNRLLLPGIREFDVDEAKERGDEIKVPMEGRRGCILHKGVRWLRMILTMHAVVRQRGQAIGTGVDQDRGRLEFAGKYGVTQSHAT